MVMLFAQNIVHSDKGSWDLRASLYRLCNKTAGSGERGAGRKIKTGEATALNRERCVGVAVKLTATLKSKATSKAASKPLDCRVKPGNDEIGGLDCRLKGYSFYPGLTLSGSENVASPALESSVNGVKIAVRKYKRSKTLVDRGVRTPFMSDNNLLKGFCEILVFCTICGVEKYMNRGAVIC